MIVAPGDLRRSGLRGAEGGEGGIDETVRQVFVAPLRNAQPSGLDHLAGALADIVDEQSLGVEALCVPLRHLQPHGLAQQGLAGAQAADLAEPALAVRVQALHPLQRRVVADAIQPGMAGLDQVRSIIPVRFNLAGGQKMARLISYLRMSTSEQLRGFRSNGNLKLIAEFAAKMACRLKKKTRLKT